MLKFFILAVLASQAVSHDLDDILDRLEEKLKRNETEEMGSAPEQKYREPHYTTQSTTRMTPTSDLSIQNIEKKVHNLEQQIGDLEKGVEILFQETLQQAKSKNVVKITASIIAEGSHEFSSLIVELDGKKIYYSDTETGFWVPDDHLPVFWGTLSPGSHSLKMTARIHRVAQTTHPVRGERLIQKDFKVNIPSGPYEKEWKITLQPDQNATGDKEASLVEEELS
ncbi:MAG: hypothetical protein AB8C84_07310 [Oligoflexales bacterium]